MFKTDSFLGNKKLNLNQNVWRDHVIFVRNLYDKKFHSKNDIFGKEMVSSGF